MSEEIKDAMFCPTNTGNGYKIVVNGVWLYCSKKDLQKVVQFGGKCRFNTIDDTAPQMS